MQPYSWAAPPAANEVDFILEHNEQIIPVEVKAEKNLQAKSLKFYCKKYGPPQTFRISMGNYYQQKITSGETEYLLTDLPLFAISQLRRLCKNA